MNSSRCTRYAIVSSFLFLCVAGSHAGSYYTPFGRFGQRCITLVCPEITGLAILRAVDEFRFEGRSTKGGRETADAICVALRLISPSLFLAITTLVCLTRSFHSCRAILIEPFIVIFARNVHNFHSIYIKIPYLPYILFSFTFSFL